VTLVSIDSENSRIIAATPTTTTMKNDRGGIMSVRDVPWSLGPTCRDRDTQRGSRRIR
jgi:hypothetical protein